MTDAPEFNLGPVEPDHVPDEATMSKPRTEPVPAVPETAAAPAPAVPTAAEFAAAFRQFLADNPTLAREMAAVAAKPVEPEEDPEQYVHLADGSIERLRLSQVPGFAGTNAPNGHFERDGKSFLIIGVYPVETGV